jgi:hypothetical protein
MVERVARALCLRDQGETFYECKQCRNARYRFNPTTHDEEPIDDLPSGCLGVGRGNQAIAAIETMREPTDKMMAVLQDTGVGMVLNPEPGVAVTFQPVTLYRAMIDAALGKEP